MPVISTNSSAFCINRPRVRITFTVHCSDSKPNRGFGRQSSEKDKVNKVTTSGKEKRTVLQQGKSTKTPSTAPSRAPGLSSQSDGRPNKSVSDVQFEERLQVVKRSALEQKKAVEKEEYGAIDYDAPPADSEKKTIGLGTKIGIGAAVVVFGLVFALGDFLPSDSGSSTDDTAMVTKNNSNNLSEEQKVGLQARLREYQATLSLSPKDPAALEGAAVTLAELGAYNRAASLLEDLTKEKPTYPDAFRLLGEVKYELKDYEGSVAAYKSSFSVSKTLDFEVLRGLTNALLAAKKPDEAVQVLLASRERLNTEKSNDVDLIQVELLLGKAYSDWGHVSDAVAVYDQLIASYPNDFRGYLAKGIILKENGKSGDAERMFIQARFFAPQKAKVLVDRYSGR